MLCGAMKYSKRILALSLGLALATTAVLYHALSRGAMTAAQRADARWIATSPAALDRAACRLLRVCGGTHWLGQTWPFRSAPAPPPPDNEPPPSRPDDWIDPTANPAAWSDDERTARDIPDYVLDHAPFVFLDRDETYWPSDPADHLRRTTPTRDGAAVGGGRVRLDELDELNGLRGAAEVYLTSHDDVQAKPAWIRSRYNVPNPYPEGAIEVVRGRDGRGAIVNDVAKAEGWYSAAPVPFPACTKPDVASAADAASVADSAISLCDTPAPASPTLAQPAPPADAPPTPPDAPGRSAAPAFLVMVRKEHGVVDAFWFFFYSFNRGNKVLGVRYGNHVGDWEHATVRFQHGVPRAVYTSRHSFGASSYSYAAVEKIGKRVRPPIPFLPRRMICSYVCDVEMLTRRPRSPSSTPPRAPTPTT